jgi:hypothetical protein
MDALYVCKKTFIYIYNITVIWKGETCLLSETQLYKFVRISQETHYVFTMSPTGYCYL